MDTAIKDIRVITDKPLEPSVEVIRRAFGTVAKEMGITEQNAPRYTAFITPERLEESRKKSGVFWGLFENEIQVGFVALEVEDDGKYWMKRLAVLPEYRHSGSGKALVDKVIEYARAKGQRKLYIAMVNEQKVLKEWYLKMGFKITNIEKFPNLPFSVAFMELEI